MSLSPVPDPEPCRCERFHQHISILATCMCECHGAGPLTEAQFMRAWSHLAGERHLRPVKNDGPAEAGPSPHNSERCR